MAQDVDGADHALVVQQRRRLQHPVRLPRYKAGQAVDECIAYQLRLAMSQPRKGRVRAHDFVRALQYARDGGPLAAAIGVEAYSAGEKRAEVGDTLAMRRLKEGRSEEHTSELQSLMRISYAVFCLKTKNELH